MPELLERCDVPGIPERLHTSHRPVQPVQIIDRVFLRHESLESAESYGLEIPGYRPANQSANSEQMNPDGTALDVLLNTEGGEHFLSQQIACLDLSDLVVLSLKNPHTVIRYDRNKNPINDLDEYTFRVSHQPTRCMYPHCEIIALKNGVAQKVSKGFRTVIRAEIARLADKNRKAMLLLKP